MIILGLLLCGCPGPSAPDGSNTTVLSPGFGIENEEPLWPMTPGWVGSGGGISVVREPIVIRGQELMRFAGPLPFLSLGGQLGPAEPAQWSFWSQSDEGLLLRGFLREGIWDAPVLFLPRHVRAGMMWDAHLRDGTLRYRFMIGVEYRHTRFGPRRVWSLSIFDAHARRSIPDRTEYGVTSSMEFIEGRGPIDGEVVPLDPSTSTPVPRVALRKLNAGQPITGGRPTRVEGLVRPSDSDALILSAGLEVPFTDNQSGGPPMSVAVAATGCARYTTAGGFESLTADQCRPVMASVIQPSGERLTLGCEPFEASQRQCETYVPAAVYVGSDGKTYVHGARFDRPDTLAWSEVMATSTTPVCCAFDSTIHESAAALFAPFGERLDYGTFAGQWVTPIGDDLAMVGESKTGYLAFGRIDASRSSVADLHFAETSLSPINWTLSAAGREAARTDPDGRVELLGVESGGITVRRFDLDLPAGAFLGGALVHQGKVLALVSEGFKGNDAQLRDDGYDPAFGLELGGVYAYEADVPANLASTPSARFSIHADRPEDPTKNGVARICVPPAVGPLSTAGWSINGRLARYASLSRGGSCVSLLFPPPEIETDLNGQQTQGENDAYDIVGAIPTVGKTAIWPRRSATTYVGPGDAPLATGGSISMDGRVRDELGFLETMSDTAADIYDGAGHPAVPMPDRAGGGLWGTEKQQDLVLVTRGAAKRWPGLGPPLFAVSGGGVVVAGGLLHAGDASPTPLRALPAGFERREVLSDGTQCGFSDPFTPRVACLDAAGVMHESTQPVTTTIYNGLDYSPVPFFAIGDAIYVVQSGPTAIARIIKFDRNLATSIDYPARALGYLYQSPLPAPYVYVDPDGDAYTMIEGGLLAFRSTGIERAALPAATPISPYGVAVLATHDLFVFSGGGVAGGPLVNDIKLTRAELAFAPVDPTIVTCPAGQHACGIDCRDDGPDDIATGCQLGCGVACAPPPFATAVCTAGACDFVCDAAHPRVGSSCSCTALACGALECGPPDCGSSVSCGTCPNNGTCIAGHCGCVDDAYEPNDASAKLVTRLENGVHAAQLTSATLTTPTDVDRYEAYVMDPGFQNTALHFAATLKPGASNLSLVVGFARGGCSVSCAQGTTINTAGVITCAATASAAAATVEVAAQCPGNDDSGAFDMTVTAAGAISDCGLYGVDYSAVAQ